MRLLLQRLSEWQWDASVAALFKVRRAGKGSLALKTLPGLQGWLWVASADDTARFAGLVIGHQCKRNELLLG